MWRNLGDATVRQLNENTGTYQALFRKTARENRAAALAYLNEDRLAFPLLYVLLFPIEELGLTDGLSDRNREALTLCAKKLNRRKLLARLRLPPAPPARIHQSRLWIFQTGRQWQPAENQADYDAVLDGAAAQLIQSGENSILAGAVELLFSRNRAGRCIHDLTWAVFLTADPGVFRRIAAYLLSDHPEDAILACRLLHLTCQTGEPERRRLYEEYLLWLSENHPYLYFTGESLQQTSEPAFLGVDLQAKYLGVSIHPRNRTPLSPLTDEQQESARVFLTLDEPQKEELAGYSHRLRRADPAGWARWQSLQFDEQTAVARGNKEMV